MSEIMVVREIYWLEVSQECPLCLLVLECNSIVREKSSLVGFKFHLRMQERRGGRVYRNGSVQKMFAIQVRQ